MHWYMISKGAWNGLRLKSMTLVEGMWLQWLIRGLLPSAVDALVLRDVSVLAALILDAPHVSPKIALVWEFICGHSSSPLGHPQVWVYPIREAHHKRTASCYDKPMQFGNGSVTVFSFDVIHKSTIFVSQNLHTVHNANFSKQVVNKGF